MLYIFVKYFLLTTFFIDLVSYNEEIFLWLVYIFLFLLILKVLISGVSNYILNASFDLLKFYEQLLVLKTKLLNQVLILCAVSRFSSIFTGLFFFRLNFVLTEFINSFMDFWRYKSISVLFQKIHQ